MSTSSNKREIKFRAWHPTIKNMMPVETIDWDETGYLTEVTAGYTWGEKFDPIKFSQLILMQFTSLKDKNGKEIYEGDILNKYQNAVVCFSRGTFQPHYDGGNAEEVEDPFYTFAGKCEVIGNIYENPELLS